MRTCRHCFDEHLHHQSLLLNAPSPCQSLAPSVDPSIAASVESIDGPQEQRDVSSGLQVLAEPRSYIQCSSKSHGSSDSNMKYVPSSIEGSSMVFAISQLHCTSKYDHTAKGGSNIEIFIRNHLSSCNVLDSFNGSYKAFDEN